MRKIIAIALISFLALPAFAGKNDDVLKERKKTRTYRACEAYGRAGGSIYFTPDGKCHIDNSNSQLTVNPDLVPRTIYADSGSSNFFVRPSSQSIPVYVMPTGLNNTYTFSSP